MSTGETGVLTSGRVLMGGIVAGVAQIVTVYVVAAIIGFSLGDAAQLVGSVVTAGMASTIWWGRGILAAMAVVWALLYSEVSPRLPGEGWQNGLLYGVLVWILSTIVFFPLLAAFWPGMTTQAAAAGLFGLGFGGWGSVVTALAAHVVYGIVLGSCAYGGDAPHAERRA